MRRFLPLILTIAIVGILLATGCGRLQQLTGADQPVASNQQAAPTTAPAATSAPAQQPQPTATPSYVQPTQAPANPTTAPAAPTTAPAVPVATPTPMLSSPTPTAYPVAPTPTAYPVQPTPTPYAPAAAPTMAPAPTVAPQKVCLPTADVADWRNSSSEVGDLIIRLNEAFDSTGGRVGRTHEKGPFRIQPTDIGSGGAVVIWTDTVHREFRTLDGQPVDRVVFKILTQGSWGTYVAFGPVEVPSPGRYARLCDSVTDLQSVFPDAVAAVNP